MLFEFYWSWYDEYSPHLFEGGEKTQEEFETDCKRALKESFNDYINQADGRSWAGLPDWIEYALPKMEEYGYKKIEPMSFGYSGLFLPRTNRYCEKNNEIEMDGYKKDFPEFLDEIKRMIAHNDRVDEDENGELYKQIEEENKNDG